MQLSQADRCALFTLHVSLLTKLKQLDQAGEVVKTAIAEFAGALFAAAQRRDGSRIRGSRWTELGPIPKRELRCLEADL